MFLENFGEIKFNKSKKEWFGVVKNICPSNEVELIIEVNNEYEDLLTKFELIKELSLNYENIIKQVHVLIYEKYMKTPFNLTIEDIEKMYYLTCVNLKLDNKTWWLVLEPHSDVASIYNHFLRFTMLERTIIWTNL